MYSTWIRLAQLRLPEHSIDKCYVYFFPEYFLPSFIKEWNTHDTIFELIQYYYIQKAVP